MYVYGRGGGRLGNTKDQRRNKKSPIISPPGNNIHILSSPSLSRLYPPALYMLWSQTNLNSNPAFTPFLLYHLEQESASQIARPPKGIKQYLAHRPPVIEMAEVILRRQRLALTEHAINGGVIAMSCAEKN